MSVREVGVKLGAPLIAIETRQWANQLVASKLPKEFVESLRFTVPLNYPLNSQLGFTRDESQKLEFGSYTVRFSMPKSQLGNRETFRVTPGIPTTDGVWFLGSITPSTVTGSAREAIVDEGDASEGELQRLRRRVADMVSGFPRLDSDVTVFANASFFNKVIQAFNGLPQEKRGIHAQLISREGHISKSYNKVDIVGEGGYYANFKNDDSLNGVMTISALAPRWVDGRGLTLTGTAAITAHADILLHIDPYVGGGFTTSLGIDGYSSIPLPITLDARKIDLGDGSSAAVIGPVIACEQIPLTLEGGGEIRFGVKSFQYIGESQPDPQILLSSDVSFTRLVSDETHGSLKFDTSYWAAIRIIPASVSAREDGYRISANVASSLVTGDPKPPLSDDTIHERILVTWKQQVQTTCPDKKDAIFLFAGQEFGPNNEIVKALAAISKAAKQAEHNVDVSWERIERVAKDPTKAPEVAGEVIDNVFRETGKAFRKIADGIRNLF